VFAYLGMPKDVSGKVPGMVLVHGGGGQAFEQWAQMWADRGYAAIAMDLGGRGPGKTRLEDGGPEQDDTAKFVDIQDGPRAAWPYHAVANVIRGHSLLRSLPEVDAGRTGVTGISWGGYLTCIVSGVDDRFQVAVPVYGCGFLHHNSAWLKQFGEMSAENKARWVEFCDPSQYLISTKMPILFVNGTNDFAYPLDSYQKSYRLVKGERNLSIQVEMKHSHPDGWAPVEIQRFMDHHLRGKVGMPVFRGMKREGRTVSARVESPTKIVSAALNTTGDTVTWNQRKWVSAPARVEGEYVQGTLPGDGVTTYYLTVVDETGVTISTEHAVVE
jgi:cephalosporin-C deacetylase-like acetyl esterase